MRPRTLTERITGLRFRKRPLPRKKRITRERSRRRRRLTKCEPTSELYVPSSRCDYCPTSSGHDLAVRRKLSRSSGLSQQGLDVLFSGLYDSTTVKDAREVRKPPCRGCPGPRGYEWWLMIAHWCENIGDVYDTWFCAEKPGCSYGLVHAWDRSRPRYWDFYVV